MLAVVKPAELKLVASGGSAGDDAAHLRATWAGHLAVCVIQIVGLRMQVGALAGLSPSGAWTLLHAHAG
jgi:hypothetical protein